MLFLCPNESLHFVGTSRYQFFYLTPSELGERALWKLQKWWFWSYIVLYIVQKLFTAVDSQITVFIWRWVYITFFAEGEFFSDYWVCMMLFRYSRILNGWFSKGCRALRSECHKEQKAQNHATEMYEAFKLSFDVANNVLIHSGTNLQGKKTLRMYESVWLSIYDVFRSNPEFFKFLSIYDVIYTQ